jgi:tRNA dimethylallyltransferase
MINIIVVCGPTGIGKTAFSISLAKAFNGEIISADSMQIYKYMDIGTAKPSKAETDAARHHLIDFVDPAQPFDAGRFIQEADYAIQDLVNRKKLPIVAGGTGLYIRALLHGLFRTHPVCQSTMDRLTGEMEEKGIHYLHDRLKQCDPAAAQKIHPNDSFRVLRALEVWETTGKSISDRQTEHNFADSRYHYLKIGLKMDREQLYHRINSRVDLMLEAGLLNEVRQLVKKGYSLDLKSMQSIGYKQLGLFLKNEVDYNEAVRLLKRDSRRYAKRQFTWFNRDKDIHWLEPDQIDTAKKLVKDFLT